MSAHPVAVPTGAEQGVRQRRQRLLRAMVHLEKALTKPAGADPEEWRDEVRRALLDLGLALDDHARETEADDGLLQQIVTDAPRLANQVGRIRDEHDVLSTSCTAIAEDLSRPDALDVAAVREAATALLGVLVRHRQAGSDLLYEAYSIDVGGGD